MNPQVLVAEVLVSDQGGGTANMSQTDTWKVNMPLFTHWYIFWQAHSLAGDFLCTVTLSNVVPSNCNMFQAEGKNTSEPRYEHILSFFLHIFSWFSDHWGIVCVTHLRLWPRHWISVHLAATLHCIWKTWNQENVWNGTSVFRYSTYDAKWWRVCHKWGSKQLLKVYLSSNY